MSHDPFSIWNKASDVLNREKTLAAESLRDMAFLKAEAKAANLEFDDNDYDKLVVSTARLVRVLKAKCQR